ncbi:MAG: serine/threonine protein kinase [Anaerolineae bacterium]|nr:serine/threonine protein kinase [Anaerolineae bacterium]
MEPELRTLNGRYRLLERIGSGGMAAVYRAQDLKLGRFVAIKMLHETLTSDENFLRNFQQEAHAAANLTHPNIVTVHDIGQDGHRHYIVMEFIDGQTLKQLIREQNQNTTLLPINRTLDLIIQTCNGLGYAHRANLVHCDMKPQNILVTRDDRVKVADFGIARAISEASQQLGDNQVWGTPQYFSPEQAAGETPTPASDVYGIGVIMFEMLTGHLPFTADTPTALALKHLQETPPSVIESNPTVPRQLDQIIQKLLAKEPTARYRTAGQLGRVLQTYRDRSLADTGPIYPAITMKTVAVVEQDTQFYQRPISQPTATEDEQDTPIRPQKPIKPQQSPKQPPQPQPANQPSADPDWTIIGLGIGALIMLLGLIPLWFFIYRAWTG